MGEQASHVPVHSGDVGIVHNLIISEIKALQY